MSKKKTLSNLLFIMMMAICSMGIASCSSDDDDPSLIPAGIYIWDKYIEAPNNYYQQSLEVSGDKIIWTYYTYSGRLDAQKEYFYKIEGHQITLMSSRGTNTLFYNREGNKITIADVTFIKQ